MKEIKRYDIRLSLKEYREADNGNMVTYDDHLEALALLEARCKELESSLPREKLLKMKMACERLISPCTANMAGRSVNMMSILDAQAVYHSIVDAPSILKLVEAALSTPTTDEHLQKLFTEWLGEPVAYRYDYKVSHIWDTRLMFYKPSDLSFDMGRVANIEPLYAPKKVSE